MINHPFRYVGPTGEQAQQMEQLSDMFAAIYDRMVATVKPSPERTLAIRNLQQARMWINAAILGIEISTQ